MAELSQPTQKLIERYKYWLQSITRPEGVPLIHVDEVASGVASFYEKIRGVIEWREEHLLRKSAIERMLKRRLMLKKDGDKIAESLVFELIRGGHFQNDSLPETKIVEVQTIVDKYSFITDNFPQNLPQSEKTNIFNWIVAVCASEIEAAIAPPIKENALINYMTELMAERTRVSEGIFVVGGLDDREKSIQIYIACQRALFKVDDSTITYRLLEKTYQDWEAPTKETLNAISQNISNIRSKIDKALYHPWSEKFYNICERYDTTYLILGDIISKTPTESQIKLEDSQWLEEAIKSAYKERFLKLRKRLARAAIFSTVSIFITKIFSALIMEVPFDMYVTGQFSYQVLGINILIPPLLMFILVSTIRPPRPSNLQKVIMEVFKIVHVRERTDIYEVRKPKKKGIIIRAFITLLYVFGFLGSFGAIIMALRELNFGILSMIIFLAFLSLISYAGVKIRQRARELLIEEPKEGFFTLVVDFFSLPVIRVGKWMTRQWEKHNAIVIIFNSLIDLPFQVFIEFLEQWRSFLKEKKEEIH